MKMGLAIFWLPIIGGILLGGIAIGAWFSGYQTLGLWTGFVGAVCFLLLLTLQLQQGISEYTPDAPNDAEIARLRAYVHIDRIVTGENYLRVIVVNRGATPASGLTGNITYQWLPGANSDLPPGFVFDEKLLAPYGPALLGSQQERSIRFEIDAQRFRLANEGRLTLFVLARIAYNYVFSIAHTAVEALKYRRAAGGNFGFETYGNYSHTD